MGTTFQDEATPTCVPFWPSPSPARSSRRSRNKFLPRPLRDAAGARLAALVAGGEAPSPAALSCRAGAATSRTCCGIKQFRPCQATAAPFGAPGLFLLSPGAFVLPRVGGWVCGFFKQSIGAKQQDCRSPSAIDIPPVSGGWLFEDPPHDDPA
jgi:hypothetical protein